MPTLATLDQIEEVLADLDPMLGAVPETLTAADLADLGIKSPIAGFAGAIQGWHQRDDEHREKRARERRNTNAAEERQRYHDEVLERTGSAPRPYERHEHTPRQPHETEADRQRRMKRDRQRKYRGVTAEQVEANATARQAVTPEDRKRKRAEADAARNATPEQREVNRVRKANQRAKKKAEAQAKIAAAAMF